MSLSIVIVDDEQLARDELAFLLRDVEGILPRARTGSKRST
jgi:FixJ family two-component response regulator